MPSIEIIIPTNRRIAGTLKVLDAAGRPIAVMPCLARAAQELSSAAGNPGRNPTKRNGDTPVGDYLAPAGVEPRAPGRQRGFGTHWIPLDPVGGQAQVAEDNGRAGLAIHGGRGDTRLVPTAGCIRVFDADFARLVAALRGAKGFKVTVQEATP